MKIIVIILALTAVCFASTAESAQKGTYKIETEYSTDSMKSHGLAIQDDLDDRIWLLDRIKSKNHQFDMQTGARTGVKWSVADDVNSTGQAFCAYTDSPDQFIIGDWDNSSVAVFDVFPSDGNPAYKCSITGSDYLDEVYAVAAGSGYLYTSDCIELTWGKYTGTETSVAWTTHDDWEHSTAGLAVYGEYLFVCNSNTEGTAKEDNILIFSLGADGSPSAKPVWSCLFTENPGWGKGPNGGIDFDGEFLWLCPMEYDILKISIDWEGGSSRLEPSSWGSIKASF